MYLVGIPRPKHVRLAHYDCLLVGNPGMFSALQSDPTQSVVFAVCWALLRGQVADLIRMFVSLASHVATSTTIGSRERPCREVPTEHNFEICSGGYLPSHHVTMG